MDISVQKKKKMPQRSQTQLSNTATNRAFVIIVAHQPTQRMFVA